jgi:cellulose 1,4-beta-cellobiosidase
VYFFFLFNKISAIVPGTIKDEFPKLNNFNCVLDANWRWLHYPNKYENCFDGVFKCGNDCDTCVLEGVTKDKYETVYGVQNKNSDLILKFVTGSNVGSRLYLLNNDKYWLPNLLNKQISITVDISIVPCSLNAALYLVEMNSTVLDTLGVGYGDAQCPTDIKYFYDGNVNVNKDPICSTEIDLLELNSEAMAWTLHPCNEIGCDKPGADANSYRQGYKNFYGSGKTIDTKKPFQAITQFIGDPLKEVKRIYKQGNNIYEHPGGSLTSESIKKWKTLQKETNYFETYGGFASLTKSIKKGMAVVLSIWDDQSTNMAWLDSGDRGPCISNPNVRQTNPDAFVIYKDIKLEDIITYEALKLSSDTVSEDTTCSTTTVPSAFCCFYSSNKEDYCKLCNSIADKSNWCAQSETNCNSCNGKWCK